MGYVNSLTPLPNSLLSSHFIVEDVRKMFGNYTNYYFDISNNDFLAFNLKIVSNAVALTKGLMGSVDSAYLRSVILMNAFNLYDQN